MQKKLILDQNLCVKQIEDTEYEIFAGDVCIGCAQIYMYVDEILIDNLDIFVAFQRKGYGKAIVEMLRRLPGIQSLRGESVPEAIPFWDKMGAVFAKGEMEEWLNAPDDKEFININLIPFVIKV